MGGVALMLTGHLAQLPPVNAPGTWFMDMLNEDRRERGDSSGGARLTETRFQQAVLQRQLADEAAAAACCEALVAAGHDVLWVLDRGAWGGPVRHAPSPFGARGRLAHMVERSVP